MEFVYILPAALISGAAAAGTCAARPNGSILSLLT